VGSFAAHPSAEAVASNPPAAIHRLVERRGRSIEELLACALDVRGVERELLLGLAL